MACLRNSQCKLKLLHLPTGEFVNYGGMFNTLVGKPLIYPVDTVAYSYKAWVGSTLVNGEGKYVPYADWVIARTIDLKGRGKAIWAHFVVMYD